MDVLEPRVSLAELRSWIEDPDTDLRALRRYLRVDEALSRPFAPAVTIDPELVEEPREEGGFLVGLLNTWVRRRRRRRYERDKNRPGSRRLVSEGDSWFQFPVLLDDTIDQLTPHYAILSLGAAGDTLGAILERREYMEAIASERPSAFLLSAGGNDVLGDGRLERFIDVGRGPRPEDHLNDAFDTMLANVINQYRTLLDEVVGTFSELPILCHGYDHAIPRNGRALGQPMRRAGVEDEGLQRRIVEVMVDRFNTRLAELAATYGGRVHLVDCVGAAREVIDRGGEGWYDELHPTDADAEKVAGLDRGGFEVVGERFRRALERVLASDRERSPGGEEGMSPRARRRITARIARRVLHRLDTTIPDDAEVGAIRRMVAEKIHLESDFLPAAFLRDGAAAARAVCRVVTSTSLGSGALVADGSYVITNNHVLRNEDEARGATAEFGFEEGRESVHVALRPDRLFVTDEDLDFTIVACDPGPVADVVPLALGRDPTDLDVEMRVNVIQHPRGRAKEVALHDNRVVAISDRLVRYTTDTQRGSSGSPVFDNAWRFVALHRAGYRKPDGTAVNEGARVPAITAKLVAMANGAGPCRAAAERLLPHIQGTSPFLGFFDVAGVVDDPREVEVPTFTGTADFADVGFWNIEQFNGDVAQDRVRRVADVLGTLSMDVMGLVEVQRRSVERLVEEMRRRGDAAAFVFHDTTGGLDHAVLFDRDTTTVEIDHDVAARHAVRLAARTATGKPAFPRTPLFARCEVDDGNRPPLAFMLIVVHLKAFGDVESRARRRLAAEVLGEVIADIRSDGTPVVLGGDFNESVNNQVLQGLLDTPDLFALTSDDEDRNAAIFIGGARRSAIDHIVISDDVRTGDIMGDDAAIVRLDRRIRDFADGVSDHVPVVMRMVARARPLDVEVEPDTGQRTVFTIPSRARSARIVFA